MIKLPTPSASDTKNINHTQSVRPNNTSTAGTSSTPPSSSASSSQTATPPANQPQQSLTSNTSSTEIKTLQQQLQQRQVVTAEVVSAQALNKQDHALLQKTQPALFNQLTTQGASATQAQQGTATTTGLNNTLVDTTLNNGRINTKLDANQSTTLYLIKLVSQQQSLTTLSSTRLLPGTTLQLQQNAQQQLQIQTVVGNTQLKSGLIESYKQALPLQKAASQTLQVAQLLQQLPSPIKQQLLPAKLLSALATVTQFAQSDKTLQQPQQLQAAIKNSGLFLENKIYTAAIEKNTSTLSNTPLNPSNNSNSVNSINNGASVNHQGATAHKPINQDLRTSLGQLQQQLSSAATTNKDNNTAHNMLGASSTTNKPTGQTNALNQTASPVGTKIQITPGHSEALPSSSGNSQKLEQFIQLLLSALPQSTNSTTAQQQSTNLPTKELQNILQLLGIRVGVEQTPQKVATEFIGQQLKQLISGANEKNRLNQLRSLGIDTNSNIDTHTTNKAVNFTTELPLRWGEQILPLHLSIREQAQENYSEQQEGHNTEKESESARQWHIFLSFELPNNEQLHTQVSLIEHTLSATVWAESQQLCDQAQQQLGQLRKNLTDNGFMVEDIYCIQGKPPQQDTALAYNLVDIKT